MSRLRIRAPPVNPVLASVALNSILRSFSLVGVIEGQDGFGYVMAAVTWIAAVRSAAVRVKAAEEGLAVPNLVRSYPLA